MFEMLYHHIKSAIAGHDSRRSGAGFPLGSRFFPLRLRFDTLFAAISGFK
jgi:hypothetical protein